MARRPCRHPGVYIKRVLPGDKLYDLHYDGLEPGALFIKLDDDTVYIADHTIEHLVRRACTRARSRKPADWRL
jgi:hypothetical protein